MSQKSIKVPFLSLCLTPHIHSFGYWHLAKLYSNLTRRFFDTLKRLSLSSSGKRVVFFPIAVVLGVEKKNNMGGSLRHKTLHCPQHLCATSSSHPWDISFCSNMGLLLCSEKKSTEGLAKLPGSGGTGRGLTAMAGARTVQQQRAPTPS